MINIEHEELTMSYFVDPVDLFGAPYGRIFQQYVDGVPQKDFMITTGVGGMPVSLWNNEDGELKLSSETKKDLREFRKGVQYRYLPHARIDMVIKT